MKAFHNDPKIKKQYLSRVMAHEKADEIAKGFYWKDGKGCAVGCTIHGDDHWAYEKELGIPYWLARLEDRLFEGMSLNESKKWPRLFLQAIKPGADLNKIKIPFWIIVVESVLDKFDHNRFPKCKARVDAVLKELKKKKINREKILAAANLPIGGDAAYAADSAYADSAADARENQYIFFAKELLKLLRSLK